MRVVALLLVACGSSGPSESDKVCRQQRDAVVTQLGLAEQQLERVAKQPPPLESETNDTEIGKIQAVESKAMVTAFNLRRELIPATREAIVAAAAAWKGEGDVKAATAALTDKLVAYDTTHAPVTAAFTQSKKDVDALVDKLQAQRNDPKADQAMIDRQLKLAANHQKVADLWLRTQPMFNATFDPLRKSIDAANTVCAKK